MELETIIWIILIILLLTVIMIIAGRLKLSQINHKSSKSPLLELEFGRKRFEIDDKLRSGFKSIRLDYFCQNKTSDLTKIHNKLRESNLNDSQLNIFPGDLQNIVFEMSDETDYEDEMEDVSSNTDTFLDTDDAVMPVPITLRVASLKKRTD